MVLELIIFQMVILMKGIKNGKFTGDAKYTFADSELMFLHFY